MDEEEYRKKWIEAEYATMGWLCPKCKRGLAPHVSECSCEDEKRHTLKEIKEMYLPDRDLASLRENTESLIEWGVKAQKIGITPPEA